MINTNDIPVLIPYDQNEFWNEIRKIVAEELAKSQNEKLGKGKIIVPSGLTEKPLYQISEVCALFNITRTTVHDWAQAGKLRKVKVRSRVYFLASEIRKMLE